MMISFNLAVNGIDRAFVRLDRGAQKINNDRVFDGYLDMNQAVRAAEANLATLKSQDRMMKTTVDIFG